MNVLREPVNASNCSKGVTLAGLLHVVPRHCALSDAETAFFLEVRPVLCLKLDKSPHDLAGSCHDADRHDVIRLTMGSRVDMQNPRIGHPLVVPCVTCRNGSREKDMGCNDLILFCQRAPRETVQQTEDMELQNVRIQSVESWKMSDCYLNPRNQPPTITPANRASVIGGDFSVFRGPYPQKVSMDFWTTQRRYT